MKIVKLMFLVVAILAISAPAFAACGICVDNGNGAQCDGTPGTPCRMLFHIDYIECFDGQGFCHGAAAPEVASAQWVVASVETNGVVTAAEVPQTRTARVEGSGAEATAAR
ncbi:MAG: hypothetical protein JWN02_293 [Acidobacteria bacterium]|nr:hypothetical protein [Acidobacteriota bacterium]